MTAFSVSLLVAIAAIAVLRFFWNRRRFYALSMRLNGRFGYPFIGNALQFIDATKVVSNMQAHADRYGNLSQLWIGPRLFVFVDNPADVELILNSPDCIDKGRSYRFIDTIVGKGLISMKSIAWRVHRKLLNPSFSYNITNQFVPIFNKHLRIMSECLAAKCGGKAFNILHILKTSSMDMICETTMDRMSNGQTVADGEYFAAIDNALATTAVRMFNPIYQSDLLFRMSSLYDPLMKSAQVMRQRVEDIINAKMQDAEKNISVSKLKNSDELASTNYIFIDRVLRLSLAEKTFSLEDVLSETNTVLLAGFETTATSTAFIMLMLAMYPDLQQRVYDEMNCIHIEDGTDVTQADLAHLKYLDMFIKETLRIFPSVPFLTRTATSDLKLGDYIIPAGVEFILGVMAMHRSAANFKNDPATFNPDNFLPANSADRHAYSYIPFSGGPRGCIGIKYAIIVLKLTTVYVMKRFRLSTTMKMDELRLRMNVTLNLINTHQVQVHRR